MKSQRRKNNRSYQKLNSYSMFSYTKHLRRKYYTFSVLHYRRKFLLPNNYKSFLDGARMHVYEQTTLSKVT